MSKCEFGMTDILYFGHVIEGDGVQEHQAKIRGIGEWPTPKNVAKIKIFLDLYTYYMKFVKGFSQITMNIRDLAKKGDFSWKNEAHATFERMKQVMSSCPLLALLNITQPFML